MFAEFCSITRLMPVADQIRKFVLTIEYHLQELEIAKNPSDPRNVLPEVLSTDQAILDIGCGIGQTLIALDCPDRRRIGIDIDAEAIEYARKNFPDLEVHVRESDILPVEDSVIDLVVMRVSLPYMNIPRTVAEVQRVLRPGGRVWVTVHSRRMATGFLTSAVRNRDFKNIIHKTYVMLNGYLFHFTGKLLPFVNGRYESWQDTGRLKRYFESKGFSVSIGERNGIQFVEATNGS